MKIKSLFLLTFQFLSLNLMFIKSNAANKPTKCEQTCTDKWDCVAERGGIGAAVDCVNNCCQVSD